MNKLNFFFFQCMLVISLMEEYILIPLRMVKKAKIIFLGDSGVGKSCIISCITGNPISRTHEPTIGMDFFRKQQKGQKGTYRLQIWDTAGQERFRCILPSYIRNSKIAVLVYDVTNSNSFESIDKWIEMYKQSSSQLSQIILVGNKIDLENQRIVNIEEIRQKIQKYKIKYIEISAKNSQGIQELLRQVMFSLDKMKIPEELERKSNVILPSQTIKHKCCKQL